MFPLSVRKVVIMALLHHGTDPRGALTLNLQTNVKLFALLLFPQFLRNHL